MVFLTLLTHELGHILMAKYFNWRLLEIKLLGFSVYPEFQFSGFGDYFGTVRHSRNFVSFAEDGWVLLMGSGLNWLIAIGSLFVLYLLKIFKVVNFYLNTIFIFASLMFLDFITYMFGLRLGGGKEPLEAAYYLGWNEPIFFGIVMVLGAVHLVTAIYLIISSGYFQNFRTGIAPEKLKLKSNFNQPALTQKDEQKL